MPPVAPAARRVVLVGCLLDDLVVDTDSMIHIVGVHQQPGAVQIVNHFVHDFGTGSTVHATNYFRQAPLYTFLRETALQQTQ
jgi:hypothetical protein